MRFWGYGQSHAISCRTTTTLRFFAARTAASSTRLSDPRLFYSVCSTQKFPGGAASIYLGSLGHSAGSCPDGFTLRGMQRRQVSLGQCWRGVQRTACQHHRALLGLSAAGCTWKCLKVSTHFTVDWWWSGCEGGGWIRVPEGSCCSTRSIMPPVSVNEESTCNWHLWVAMSTLGSRIVIHRMLTHVIVAAWFTDLFGLDMLEWRFESPKTIISIHFSQFYDPRSSGVVAAAGNSTGKVVPGVVPCARLVLPGLGVPPTKKSVWLVLPGRATGWYWMAVMCCAKLGMVTNPLEGYIVYIYIYPLYIPSFDHGTYGMPWEAWVFFQAWRHQFPDFNLDHSLFVDKRYDVTTLLGYEHPFTTCFVAKTGVIRWVLIHAHQTTSREHPSHPARSCRPFSRRG